MEVLYWLESIRNPVLDAFFSAVTLLGEVPMFMVIAMAFYWCIDKRQGYFLFSVGIFGTLINQVLKMSFRVPRPWVKDPAFRPVGQAVEGAYGYSFPSGHTQCAVGMFSGIARWSRWRWLRWSCIALCVLIPVSRLYLGVHTPLDVLVSVGQSLLLVLIGYPLFQKTANNPKWMYGILLTIGACLAGYSIYLFCHTFPSEVYLPENINNLTKAKEDAVSLLGCILGLLLVYPIESKKICFSTKGVWWVQVIKLVGGILILLAVKELTKTPLEWLFGNPYVARGVRYFLVAVFGGLLWPMTFRWFNKETEKNTPSKG